MSVGVTCPASSGMQGACGMRKAAGWPPRAEDAGSRSGWKRQEIRAAGADRGDRRGAAGQHELKTLMSAFRQRLRGAVVASALGDVQVAGVFEGRDDGSPDGGQVCRPVAGPAGRTSSREVTSRTWWCASMGQCSRTSRARSCAVASALVRLVMA